jgi:DHA2 family lincomycin resistance protein-like MFS transporter
MSVTGRGAETPGINGVIALLIGSTFVTVLNETVMSVALPRFMAEMDITATTAQWLTTAFMLTMAVVIPITGSVLDRFSTRGVFFTALSLFTAGTMLAAVAPGFGVLVTARVIQAAGSALMIPLLMTTVMTFVPVHRRGRMMGLISIVISVAPAIGPTISGLVLESLSWRWLFVLMTPIALAALVLGAFMVRNVSETRPVRFDLTSIALSTLGFGGLVFGLSSIGEAEAGHPLLPPLVPLSVGAVAVALFVVRQIRLQRSDQALLDLRPFQTRGFTLPVVMVLLTMCALFGTLILLPLYLQNVLGLSTLKTGLVMLPGGVLQGIAAPVVGRLFDKIGPRPLVIPGTIAILACYAALTRIGTDTRVMAVVLIYTVLNVALAFVTTPLLTTALGSLPARLYSHGSAITNTAQQIAGATGTASVRHRALHGDGLGGEPWRRVPGR